jgi:hypothetical protein
MAYNKGMSETITTTTPKTEPNDKVYCEECERRHDYQLERRDSNGTEHCLIPSIRVVTDSPMHRERTEEYKKEHWCLEHNADNHCPDFEPLAF